VRRVYTINGTFVQKMDNSASGDGSTYMFRQRSATSPYPLISSTGTYALAGNGISVDGNGISSSTVHSCNLAGDVTFARVDSGTSINITVASVAPGVIFCNNTYTFNKQSSTLQQ
jgi:hypothetical protein